jgi:hypothetical protein
MDRARWTIGLGAAAAGGVVLVVAIGLAFAGFVATAEHAPGTVGHVTASTTCSGDRTVTRRRMSSSRSCTTWFSAEVRYREASGAAGAVWVPAGSSLGSDEPVSAATLHAGEAVPVVYSGLVPGWGYRDASGEVLAAWWWWARWPAALVVGAVTFWLVTVRALPREAD